ncbi:hypothetical protein PM082_000016 [Marasmius tenuissimus]|nr:hypothetical protein PM082_000016 [Marasmius tenuissimus]
MIVVSLFFITALNLARLAAVDLGSDFSGAGIEALFPRNAFEGASRAYNRRFIFIPSAVAYPKSSEEISKVVTMGEKNGMQVVTRSGGHSYIANGPGGKIGTLVVDMSNMKGLSVDSAPNIATSETRNRLGNIAVGLNEEGKALPYGTCPYVGIGGHSGRCLSLQYRRLVGPTFSKGNTQGKLDEVLAPFLGRMPKPATNDRLGAGTYIDLVKDLGTSKAADEWNGFYARSLTTPVGGAFE